MSYNYNALLASDFMTMQKMTITIVCRWPKKSPSLDIIDIEYILEQFLREINQAPRGIRYDCYHGRSITISTNYNDKKTTH